jgi:predicted esterase
MRWLRPTCAVHPAGRTFLRLDDGRLREDAVRDIGSLLVWIGLQPDLDRSRVVAMGGSYGGYMTLASLVNYGDRLAGGIDVVGISNFVTFLTNTASYRRDLRRVEYGDERDPDMRLFLQGISPLNNAAAIKKPLLVVQGLNDPRVPFTEAEQMVARLRSGGGEVWYLAARDEGHGFRKKPNVDAYLLTVSQFLQETEHQVVAAARSGRMECGPRRSSNRPLGPQLRPGTPSGAGHAAELALGPHSYDHSAQCKFWQPPSEKTTADPERRSALSSAAWSCCASHARKFRLRMQASLRIQVVTAQSGCPKRA